MNNSVAEFPRYAKIIEPMLAAAENARDFPAEDAAAVQVERGTVYVPAMHSPQLEPQNLIIVERLIELGGKSQLADVAVVDRAGHHRPVYRGLLVYSWLQAFRIAYETLTRDQFGRWEESARPWCDQLESELTQIDLPQDAIPAARGGSVAEAAMIALALQVAGRVYVRDAWTDLASYTLGRITRMQQPSGAFLVAKDSDNPETYWYHELVLLHCCASYAIQAEDRTIAAAVARNARYHRLETQPDHATNQPWGLFAFIWEPTTRDMADQVLHAARTQESGVSLMLLADALYCLGLFL
jgi:hypothetical protein